MNWSFEFNSIFDIKQTLCLIPYRFQHPITRVPYSYNCPYVSDGVSYIRVEGAAKSRQLRLQDH